MAGLTLLRQHHPLSDPARQIARLQPQPGEKPFAEALADAGLPVLTAGPIEVLQVNVGKVCNQTCRHCHVDAGPERKEIMTRETMQACVDVLDRGRIQTLDITGGAPEMN